MKRNENASISIMKIICVSLILLFISGIGVTAMTAQTKNVKITLANGYEMTVLTSKTKISEILQENNVILTEDENVTPNLNEELNENEAIKITKKSVQEVQIAKISENGVETSLEQILKNYEPIKEKIVVEKETIPYETITKSNIGDSKDKKSKILQQGEEGIKEVTYKIKYQNDVEIEKTKISEKIIKEPVDKIIQVQKVVTSRAGTTRTTVKNTEQNTQQNVQQTSNTSVYKVTAYCPCSKCCGKYANGYTASGTKATPGRTIAASSKFSFGTKLSINGKIYVVEDRGGAIKGNKIDMYVNSHSEALAWGVRYLPVEVVK